MPLEVDLHTSLLPEPQADALRCSVGFVVVRLNGDAVQILGPRTPDLQKARKLAMAGAIQMPGVDVVILRCHSGFNAS